MMRTQPRARCANNFGILMNVVSPFFSIFLFSSSPHWSEGVEQCKEWSSNMTQQIDLAFNIFFMVYFFIRVSFCYITQILTKYCANWPARLVGISSSPLATNCGSCWRCTLSSTISRYRRLLCPSIWTGPGSVSRFLFSVYPRDVTRNFDVCPVFRSSFSSCPEADDSAGYPAVPQHSQDIQLHPSGPAGFHLHFSMVDCSRNHPLGIHTPTHDQDDNI